MKKIIFIIISTGLLMLIIVLLIAAIFVKKEQKPNNKNVINTSKNATQINALQKAEIGKTTNSQIEKIPGVSLSSSKGSINTYTLPSIINARPNEITTNGGIASSERIVLPAYQSDKGYTSISQIIEKYGQPEEVLDGSSFYGSYASRYLYPTKGVSFIVNTNTNEVYEILHFSPMSLAAYKESFPEESKILPKTQESY